MLVIYFMYAAPNYFLLVLLSLVTLVNWGIMVSYGFMLSLVPVGPSQWWVIPIHMLFMRYCLISSSSNMTNHLSFTPFGFHVCAVFWSLCLEMFFIQRF